MILLAAFLIVAATVPLTGGKLSRLGDVRLRWVGMVVLTLLAQVAVINVFPHALPVAVAGVVHALTYLPALAFAWVNRGIRGLPLIMLGGGLNAAAIIANNGVMPSTPWAAAAAGQTGSDGFLNSAPAVDANLWFLGDIFAWPHPMPLANVFSIGDVLLLVGGLIVLQTVCRKGSPSERTDYASSGAPA